MIMKVDQKPSFILRAAFYAVVLLAFLANVSAIVFGYLNGANVGGLFNNTIGNLSAKYYNEVAPIGLIFGIIWPIIFLWTLAGSFYLVVSLCLPPYQSPVNITPAITPKIYFTAYSFGYASCVVWFFTFDEERLRLSFFVLGFGALSFYTALGISLKLVYENLAKLETKCKTMLWVVRILVQNGLGLICTWLTLATSIGFTITLLYVDSPGQDAAIKRGLVTVDNGSALVLVAVCGLILVWFSLENYFWEKYLRYLFTVYPVLIMAFSGIVAKLRPLGVDNSLIVASVNLGISVVLFLARIALSVYHFVTAQDRVSGKSDGKERLLKQ